MTSLARSSRGLTLVTLATASIASCDPPFDPQTDSRIVAEHVATVLESAARAVDGVTGDDPPAPRAGERGGMARFAAGLLGRDSAGAGKAPLERPAAGLDMTSALGALGRLLRAPAGGADGGLGLPDPRLARPRRATNAAETTPPAKDGIAESSQEIRRAIEERVLAQGNLESATATEAVYRLRAEVTCADPDDGRLEPDCERFLRKVELRVRMKRDGLAHVLDVLVGPQRRAPVTLYVTEMIVGAVADLAEVKTAAGEIAQALGEPDPGLPTRMRGRVNLQVSQGGPRRAQLHLRLLDMIEIQDDAERVTFRTEPGDVLELQANADTRSITANVAVGLTEVVGPLDDNVRRPTPSPDLRIVVAGLRGKSVVDVAADKVTVEGLSLGDGPSFAEVRGQRIVQLDLNAQDERRFDFTVTFTPEGLPRLALSPRFDVALMFKLGLIAADFDSPPPAHLTDETYRLRVDPAGGQPPVLQVREHAEGGGIELVSGRVELSSNRNGPPITATAGQCLYERTPEPDDHPVLGSLQARSCQP